MSYLNFTKQHDFTHICANEKAEREILVENGGNTETEAKKIVFSEDKLKFELFSHISLFELIYKNKIRQ